MFMNDDVSSAWDMVELLKKGTFLTREDKKTVKENLFRVRLESFQIVKVPLKGKEDVIVDITEIRDIRSGRPLRDRDRREQSPHKNQVFTLYHGTGFVLKTVSFFTFCCDDYTAWVQGLKFLMGQGKVSSYHMAEERWLWKNYLQLAKRVEEKRSRPSSFSDAESDPKLSAGLPNVKLPSFTITNGKSSPQNTSNFACRRSTTGSLQVIGSDSSLDEPSLLKINPKDLRVWLARVNATKIPRTRIEARFKSMTQPKPNYVDFAGFQAIYEELSFSDQFFDERIKILAHLNETEESQQITIAEFCSFLTLVQQELPPSKSITKAERIDRAHEIMATFVGDPYSRASSNLALDRSQFLNYLFSDMNSLVNPDMTNNVYEDMSRPLSDYWIASSHNTYLTGDQFSSQSSCEAYANVLKNGCRCIELDCWNGDVEPIIYHGHTLTSKIKLRHVLRTIREYAWVASDYPLILSIENHCDVEQQRIMAQFLCDTFEDDLIKDMDVVDDTTLPSPHDLRRKIILKHKKLPDESVQSSLAGSTSSERSCDESIDDALLFTLHSGRLYMLDPVYQTWVAYFAVLTCDHRIVYTEDSGNLNSSEENSTLDSSSGHTSIPPTSSSHSLHSDGTLRDSPLNSNGGSTGSSVVDNSCAAEQRPGSSSAVGLGDPAWGRSWYHGPLERQLTEEWITRHWYLGEGAFLIRDSETFYGDYSLSFYRNNEVHHVRIRRNVTSDGTISFGFENCHHTFHNLKSLVRHYQKWDILTSSFATRLRDAVPQRYQQQAWYHDNMRRSEAESLLSQVHWDGAFLVRAGTSSSCEPSVTESEEHIVLSFRAMNVIHHCQIIYTGFQYIIGGATFPSLVNLVHYYKRHHIYQQVRLRYAVNAELIHLLRLETRDSEIDQNVNNTENNQYTDLSHLKTERTANPTRYVAKNDFFGKTEEELTFLKGSEIFNISPIPDSDELLGDSSDQVAKRFPAYLVEELCVVESRDQMRNNPLGNLEMGCIYLQDMSCDTIDFQKPEFSSLSNVYSEKPALRLITGASQHDVACDTEEELEEWTNAIKACLDQKEKKKAQACQQMERSLRIAKQFSDLIVYCRTCSFHWDRLQGPCYEMVSFSELKLDKLVHNKTKTLDRRKLALISKYLSNHLGRVYPKASRLDSSNFDPMFAWYVGLQMVALNYQMGDRAMQLNRGRFLDNGGCGYVLKRDCATPSINTDTPFATVTFPDGNVCSSSPKETMTSSVGLVVSTNSTRLLVEVLACRHMPKVSKPCLELEIVGSICERNVKIRRRPKTSDMNLFTAWQTSFQFTVIQPASSLLRFTYCTEDKFGGDSNVIGQAVFPVSALRPGLRSVGLSNTHCQRLELSTLLVNVTIAPGKSIGSNIHRRKSESRKLSGLPETGWSKSSQRTNSLKTPPRLSLYSYSD